MTKDDNHMTLQGLKNGSEAYEIGSLKAGEAALYKPEGKRIHESRVLGPPHPHRR